MSQAALERTPPPSDRARVRRAHERGHYDRATIDAILDACPLAHVGYLRDGLPAILPTLQWREGDHVYWHGSSASIGLKQSKSAPVSLAVTLLDGLVLARSGMHHSANYRSVVLYGEAHVVADPDEKAARLEAFIESLTPGRWDMLRPMTDQELKATTVLSLTIDEASAKIRAGGPKDDEEDYALPIWAGVVPISMAVGAPQPDPRNLERLTPPDHATDYRIG